MNDDEIKTKRLSDWKPETDIRLQKALGKFVEEAGELAVAADDLILAFDDEVVYEFENELADVDAFIVVIGHVILEKESKLFTWSLSQNTLIINTEGTGQVARILQRYIGIALNRIGRCQIQGLGGSDPETKQPNIVSLSLALGDLKMVINWAIDHLKLNATRIHNRKQAKIDSKLPWVMGTATDLLPDT